MRWRLINSGNLDGYTNMAIDEAMFSLRGTNRGTPPTLRLYGWSPPAISIGYFQSPLLPLSRGDQRGDCSPLLREAGGIDVVRRLTGGGAILHDEELTFCLVTSLKDSIIPDDIFASYNIICQAIINGLQALGIAAQIRGDETALSHVGFSLSNRESNRAVFKQRETFFCFERPSKYDITYKGKKLVGSAQRRKNGLLLHHGSILLDEQNLNGSISVNSILGRKVEFEELSKNIIQGFEKELSIKLIPGELTKDEQELSHRLVTTKYNKDLSWRKV